MDFENLKNKEINVKEDEKKFKKVNQLYFLERCIYRSFLESSPKKLILELIRLIHKQYHFYSIFIFKYKDVSLHVSILLSGSLVKPFNCECRLRE